MILARKNSFIKHNHTIMKHSKAIFLIAVIFSFLSFQTNDSVVGKWELFKMETADGQISESSGRWMHFKADGILEGGNTLETTNRTGNWEYDKETKQLTISSEKNYQAKEHLALTGLTIIRLTSW